MKYKASELISRALNLADLKNTGFVSHEEHTDYINEGWKEFYQFLINIGDSQFIKEVELMNGNGGISDWTEYELPEDCYQIKSVKNKYTGSIVTRHAESEGINSNSYDVVNDRLRLYGVAQNPLLLTYYASPTYISFPDKDISVSLPDSYELVSYAKNNVLLKNINSFIIKNIKTDETVANFTIANATGDFVLGNGHLVNLVDDTLTYYNFNGDVIYSTTSDSFITFHDQDYNVYYQTYSDGNYSVPKLMNITADVDNNNKKVLFMFYDHIVYDVSTPTQAIIQVDDWDSIELPFTPSVDYDVAPAFDNKDSFILTDSHHSIYRFVIETDHLEMYQLDIKAPLFYAITEYGILTGNGTDYTLKSSIPDLEFNFPNSLFASAIAASCGVKYYLKQNASNEGLQALYDSYLYQYKNSLDQNAGYCRIQNAYN